MPNPEKPAPTPRRILLAGYRRGAFDAARELGLEIYLLTERLPRPSRRKHCIQCRQVDFTDPDLQWEELGRELRPEGVDAVTALTERSVLPAALVRSGMGIAGASPEVATLGTDKWLMKRRIREAGLRVTTFSGGGEDEPGLEELGLPLVLKPRQGSGSRGIQIVRRAEDLPDELPAGWMAERFVEGVEMSVESLVENGTLRFVNFTEYVEPKWVNLLPAALDPGQQRAVEELNRSAVTALGVERGITHLELFLTASGPVFGELAMRPPGGHLMELMEKVYGFATWRTLLQLELGDTIAPPAGKSRADGCGAVRVLHPGAGTVSAVSGVEEARRLPGVERVEIRAEPGQRLRQRVGVGQETGYVLVHGQDRGQVLQQLAAARDTIRIELRSDSPSRSRPVPGSNSEHQSEDAHPSQSS